MSWCVTSMEKWQEIHVYPNNDEHDLELTCHCKPFIEVYDTGWRIINHNEDVGDYNQDELT